MRFSAHWQIGGKDPTPLEKLGGALLPSPFTARFEFPDDHTVEMDVAIEGGAPVVQVIRIERNPSRPPLWGSELRRLPLKEWVAFAVGQTALTERPSKPGVAAWSTTTDEEAAAISDDARRRTRRRGITDELLRDVATTYRANVDDRPRDAVAERYTVALATAARYIKLARERGFLGPAPGPGKAGER